MKDTRSPIWLDIETGGVDPSNSSILSIAAGQSGDIRSTFARPVAGTFLSSFSEKNILPQLSGKSLLSEKQSIESLIQQLENNPRTPIAGFNIRGFDMGFIQRRARTYGLEKRFLQTTRGRELVDPVYQVKDIVASAISKHADIGTFKSALEGKSWSEAETSWSALPFEKRPTEYNLIAQVKGYLQADRESAMFKGWKLEDLYRLLPEQSQLAGQAHEAATDILMTQRLTQATRSGELEQELTKPARAFQWMETVKARGYHQFGPGRLLAQTDIEKMGLSVPRWYQKSSAKIIGAGIAGALALAAFSGKDDEYNTIEGLPHGGFAQSGRLQLTDFGSGWKGQYQLSNRLAKFMFVEGGGLARKLAFEGVQVNKGGAETIFKSFREAIENKYTGAGLFGRISKQLDMRALRKAESFMRDRQVGAFIAPKSYIRNAARAQGISPRKLETGVRSHEGFHLGTVELGLRNQIEDMADIVPLEFAREMQKIPAYQANPMAVTEEYLAYSQTAKHTGRTPFGVDYTPANERIQELIQQHPRLKEFVNPIMSGKDDAHNIIEGMNHRGIAHRLRRLFTPFGSGWDALRGLAKGAETFQDMISSSGFQKALSSAVELKQLGKGAMGTASLMKGSFRGKEFQFVRKQGILGESEAATMKTLQDKFAPTVYSSSEKHIDMELFEGRTASQLLKEGKLTPTNVRDIEKSVEEMHQAGLSHGDYHAGNIMVTPEGRIGAIDFGASGPIGSSGLTKLVDDQGNVVEGFYGGYTRAARKQYGKWTPEPIQIRDPEYDWGRIGQMKERMAKLQAAQPQATATSIMTGSASINTASSGMGTATGTINENTMLAVTKKVRHANLQRSAVASTWVAGKNGGKRSRL